MAMEKVVVRFEFKEGDERIRKKALTLAVNARGVDSVALVGPHRNAIEMGGVGVNWVSLTTRMAKKIGPTHYAGYQEVEGDRDGAGAGSSRGGGGRGGGGRGHGGQCIIM